MKCKFAALLAVLVLVTVANVGFAQTLTGQTGSQNPDSTPPIIGPPVPAGGLTFYTDEGMFQADAGAIVTETFVNGAAPGAVCGGGSNTLNSSTNDACFSTGEVIDGFSLMATPGAGTVYVSAGQGFLGSPMPVVGPNTFTDEMEITFTPPVDAAGLFVVALAGVPATNVDIVVEDSAANVLGTQNVIGVAAGQFFGVISDVPIAKLDFTNAVGDAELIGDLQFSEGGGTTGGGETTGGTATPATGTWGIMLLIGLMMAISVFYLRRRASSNV